MDKASSLTITRDNRKTVDSVNHNQKVSFSIRNNELIEFIFCFLRFAYCSFAAKGNTHTPWLCSELRVEQVRHKLSKNRPKKVNLNNVNNL